MLQAHTITSTQDRVPGCRLVSCLILREPAETAQAFAPNPGMKIPVPGQRPDRATISFERIRLSAEKTRARARSCNEAQVPIYLARAFPRPRVGPRLLSIPPHFHLPGCPARTAKPGASDGALISKRLLPLCVKSIPVWEATRGQMSMQQS